MTKEVKMRFRTKLGCGVAFGALLAALQPAAAQTSSINGQMNSLQQQIQQLQQQLQSLQSQVTDSQAQAQKAQADANAAQAQATAAAQASPTAAPGAGPRVVQTPTNRFGLMSADGQDSIYLTGRLNLDAGDYVNFQPAGRGSVQNLSGGFNARRARIGVVGTLFGDWSYGFIYDAGNSSDATPKGIEMAQIAYNGLKGPGYNSAIEFGYSDTFFTLDEATSSNDIMFMERASPSNIATGFNAGDFRSNFGARVYGDRWWLGAYLTGPAQGQSHTLTAEQFGAFERATAQVLQGPDYSVHLGFAVDELLKAPQTAAGGANVITLSDNPDLRIDSTALLTTGALGTLANPVSGGQVYDFETAAGYRNFFWQGELYHYDLQRQGLKTASFNGGYGQVSWTLTGENRKYNPASGAYLGIIPDRPFSLKDGGWGAWEIAGRIDYVDLNDNYNTAAGAVAGGQQTNFTVGVNWYVNTNMRFMLNYVHTDLNKVSLNAAGVPTAETGAKADAVAARAQVTW
jgi:phosphate-selective porin OprO and OprP